MGVGRMGPRALNMFCVCRLELAAWSMAWDRYAVAAAVVKQMAFSASMEHKSRVFETAVNAAGEDRLPLLGVLFDEVSRHVCATALV